MSDTATATRERGPARRFVHPGDRAAGWPTIDPMCTDTRYEVRGNTDQPGVDVVIAMTTDCMGIDVGWDTCGRCNQHVRNCFCPSGVVPPRCVVYIYRSRHRIAYPVGTRGGYFGFRHDASGQLAPMVFETQEARVAARLAAAAAEAGGIRWSPKAGSSAAGLTLGGVGGRRHPAPPYPDRQGSAEPAHPREVPP